MASPALTSGVLMDVSESWIEKIRWSGSAATRLVVDRLFDKPLFYRRWLSFHYDLMQKVAASDSQKEQLVRLRKTSFNLLHRQALFEHIRAAGVAGADREALFSALHGSASYSRAVLTEHGRFLESNSSLYCTDYLEMAVMKDTAFSAALADYRRQYMEFFAIYCSWVIAEQRGQDYFLAPVIPEMKKELLGMQRQILAMPTGAGSRPVTGGFWG
ncbi:MAG: hypothetical protein ABI661_09295 [Gammaproteobacteria bacterium]